MSESNPPLKVSEKTPITLPGKFLISIVILAAAGAVGLNSTREQVQRNTADIAVLRTELSLTRETLYRIDENVKQLKERRP